MDFLVTQFALCNSESPCRGHAVFCEVGEESRSGSILQVGVSIQVSSFNLTRIVTMSPYYTLVNKSSYELEVGEVVNASSTKWHYISSTEVSETLHLQIWIS